MTKKILLYVLIIPFFLGCTNQLKVTDNEWMKKNQGPVKGSLFIEGDDLITKNVTLKMINESSDTIFVDRNLGGSQNKVTYTFPDGLLFEGATGAFGRSDSLLPGESKEYILGFIYERILTFGDMNSPDGIYKIRWINTKYDIDVEEKIYFNMAEFQRRGY